MSTSVVRLSTTLHEGGRRSVTQIIKSEKMKEGAGFIVERPIGGRKLNVFDPFLLLDHFGPVNWAPGEAVGAPWHPHRGFETVSYILQGEMRHQDSMGNKGLLRAGDVQWMTAGSGIIHDEEPSEAFKESGGIMEGFQIWVNLPKKDKMCVPNYQDVSRDKIPLFDGGNFTVRVIAGEAFGTKAIVNTKVPIQYLDFHASKGAHFTHEIPHGFNAGAFIYRGSAIFGKNEQEGKEGEFVVFDDKEGTLMEVKVTQENGVKFLLLAGKPLNEPIARHGPFVMNTQGEIKQAFIDYQEGKLARHQAIVTSKTEHNTKFNPESKDASIV